MHIQLKCNYSDMSALLFTVKVAVLKIATNYITDASSDHVFSLTMFQVCRLVYELMMIRDLDAVRKIHSLDSPYYFKGRSIFSVANESHTATSSQELSFVVGDEIGITAQRQDGWSMGEMKNRKTRGLFPSDKVEQQVTVADFPTYNNI